MSGDTSPLEAQSLLLGLTLAEGAHRANAYLPASQDSGQELDNKEKSVTARNAAL